MPLPVTESLIHARSTAESFARGQEYVEAEAVASLVRRDDVVRADVRGGAPAPCRVTVVVDAQGELTASCACHDDAGGWCEHIVAVLLAVVRRPEAIEERPPLPELLAPLDRATLQALLLRLVGHDPALADRVEEQIGVLGGGASAAQPAQIPPAQATPAQTPPVPATPAQTPPVPAVTPATVRRQLRSVLGGIGGGRSYDYWSVGSIAGGVDRALEDAWRLIEAGTGRAALPVLDAITDEVWSAYEGLDDSDGEGGPLFDDIGSAWTEALLSPDVTREERQTWGETVETWRDQLADYGLEEGFDSAVRAAKEGWDDRRLKRVLQGQDARVDLWSVGGPPDWLADQALAQARLDILERQGRRDEFLRLADAAAQVVAYTSMLVKLGRGSEAVTYGLEHLTSTEDALALAQVLRDARNPQGALEIAERGLQLAGARATLAYWTAELAATLGETPRALAAAEIGLREVPDLDRYRWMRALAGNAWPSHRDALLDHLSRQSGYVTGAVEILLDEGRVADAMAAIDRGAHHELRERVADAALPSHPEWVIATSRREAESIMDRGKSEYYLSAAHWVRRARDAYRVAGREAEWVAYKAHLLTEHSRKYRLVPLLKAL